MMKKIFALILAVLLLCLVPAASAYSVYSRVTDSASDAIPNEYQQTLSDRLDSISTETEMDVLICVTDDLDGYTVAEFAENFYDDMCVVMEHRRSAAILVISLETRDVYIDCVDDAQKAITEYEAEGILDLMMDDLSSGDYYAACVTFADRCEAEFLGYINGPSENISSNYHPPYDYDYDDDYNYDYDEEFELEYEFDLKSDWPYMAVIAVVLGVIVAFITVTVMKSKLKSVRSNDRAAEYVVPGSMQVTVSYDSFLYRNVTRRERPKNNNSGHHGRSGGFGGGRGGFGGSSHRGSGRKF